MSRKVIMSLAISLDGFIANEEGGFDWIIGHGNNNLNTKDQWDYAKFLDKVDTIIMGSRCLEFAKDYSNKQIYVLTRQQRDNYENIKFIDGDVSSLIENLQEEEGKDIFIFGGGQVASLFINENLIDEYIIGIIPTILGKGLPLFLDINNKIDLSLTKYTISDGIVCLFYSRR